MNQPQNDPDPVWHMGPLPAPGPALTAEESAEVEAWNDYVDSMQMADIDGRVESDPNWVPTPWSQLLWPPSKEAQKEAEPGEPEIELLD